MPRPRTACCPFGSVATVVIIQGSSVEGSKTLIFASGNLQHGTALV